MKYLLLKIEVVGGDEENPILGHKEIIFTNKRKAEKKLINSP